MRKNAWTRRSLLIRKELLGFRVREGTGQGGGSETFISDPDPTFQSITDPDPNPTFKQYRIRNRIRLFTSFRIRLFTSFRIRILFGSDIFLHAKKSHVFSFFLPA